MHIYSRAEWGALPPKRTSQHGIIEGIIAHWVGGDMADNPTLDQSFTHMRSLQRAAMAEGYSDIEYSYLIDPMGRVFEGRGPSVEQGASNDYNHRTLSWCYMDGPDQDTPFTPAAQKSATELSQALALFFPKLNYVWPHSRVRPGGTQCPGDAIRAFLPTIVLRPDKPTPPPTKVTPMYSPALVLEPIVADLDAPTGGAWLLAGSGAIYAFPTATTPNYGGANGQSYFVGRVAARLEPHPSGGYTIVATSGERYDYPKK